MKRQVKKGLAVFLSVAMVLSGVSVGNLYAAEDGEGRKSVIHIVDLSENATAQETQEKETEETKKKPAPETEEKSAAETEDGKEKTDKKDAKEETAKDTGAEEAAKENTTDSTKEAAEGTAGEDTGSEMSGKTDGGNVNIEDGKDASDGENASDEEEEPVEEELENDISGEEAGAEEEAEAGEKADAEDDDEAGEKADAEEETASDDGKKEKDSLTALDEENMVAELMAVAGDYRITVSAEEAIFPETARLQAEQVEDEDTVSRIRDTTARQDGDEEGEETQEAEIVCFDLGIVDEENNEMDWEGDNALMTVSLERLLAPMALEEEAAEVEYQLYQVDKDSQEVEEKETSVNGEAVEAEMDSISRVALRAASVGDVGARSDGVTDAAALKAAIENGGNITVSGDIVLTEAVTIKNDTILTIEDAYTLDFQGRLTVNGNTALTFTSLGSESVTVNPHAPRWHHCA